jgi:hypothetical protein
MAIHITKTPEVYISASQLARLREEYRKEFSMYCGAPPNFEEWAIGRIQQKREEARNG